MGNKQTIKPLKDLTLLDRFLFAEAMDDPEINQLILEIILGKELLMHNWTQTEKEVRISPLARSIRVDVFSSDEDGNVYDAEVQKKDEGNLPRRSRLYQGLIDSTLLVPGIIDFNEMKDCYIIIISPFDLINQGRYSYTFRMRCDEDRDYCLGDGGVRIFLNTRGTDEHSASPELIELLHYIERVTGDVQPEITGDKLKQIHQRVQSVRQSEETGVKYMQLWEERLLDKQEAREEGLTEGRKEGRAIGQKLSQIILIRKNFNHGMSIESIAVFLDLDASIVKQICEKIQTEPDVPDEELTLILPNL